MNNRVSIIPGIRYNFTAVLAGCTVDPFIDFVDRDMQDILYHLRYRLASRTLVSNHLIGGEWKNEETLVPEPCDVLQVSLAFDLEAVAVQVGSLILRYPIPKSSYLKINYMRADGFKETAFLLEVNPEDGLSSVEMSSIEYTILEARLSKLELLVERLTQR